MSREKVLEALGRVSAFHVAGSAVTPTPESVEELSLDPRGIVWMWEPPLQHATYKLGLDPTVGVTGWTRGLRVEGDHKVDNAAIEIVRVGAVRTPLTLANGEPDIDPVTKRRRELIGDLQVAEYFAPVDATEAARIANALGRIYVGVDEDGCEIIHEAAPGPGLLSTQEFLRLGYLNLWHWEYCADVVEESNRIGWRSYFESQKALWYRTRIHLMEGKFQVQSPWLAAEYRNLVVDPHKGRGVASSGSHDDLVQAAGMALWAAHDWTQDPEPVHEEVRETAEVDWQRRAPVLGDAVSWREAWANALDSWD